MIPQDHELEQRVVACLLLAPTTQERLELAGNLQAKDFTDPICQLVFRHASRFADLRSMLERIAEEWPEWMVENCSLTLALMVGDRAGNAKVAYAKARAHIARLQVITVHREKILHLEKEMKRVYADAHGSEICCY